MLTVFTLHLLPLYLVSALSINNVPDTVLESKVFPYISPREWMILSGTNRHFHKLLNDPLPVIHRVIDHLDARNWHTYPDCMLNTIIHHFTENEFEPQRNKLFNLLIDSKQYCLCVACDHHYAWIRNISLDSTINLHKKFLIAVTNLLIGRKFKPRIWSQLILIKFVDQSLNNSIRIPLNDMVLYQMNRMVCDIDHEFYALLFDLKFMQTLMTKQQYLLSVLDIIRNFSDILILFHYGPHRIGNWKSGLIETGLMDEVMEMHQREYGNLNAWLEFLKWSKVFVFDSSEPWYKQADAQKTNKTKLTKAKPPTKVVTATRANKGCECTIS